LAAIAKVAASKDSAQDIAYEADISHSSVGRLEAGYRIDNLQPT